MMHTKFSNKFDRLFWISFFIFSTLITILMIRGDQTYPKIVSTNLETETIPVKTRQIILNFNRNMDRRSVEENFKVDPAILGKFSWIGKKMAYSFNEPLSAGQRFTVTLNDASDEQGVKMKEAYLRNYQTLSQKLYFIGIEESDKDRLVAYDLQEEKSSILSPENLVIKDYRIHPDQNLIYILGYEKTQENQKNSLYEIDLIKNKIEKLIDGQKEYIFSFNISPNGSILLARKAKVSEYDNYSLTDPGSLWAYQIEDGTWEEFWNKDLYGSEFYFSPDSNYLVGRLMTGDIIILPVKEDPEKVVYLENYAGSYHLSPDGSKLVFVDYKDPFSPNDLLIRKNDGTTEALVSGKGQIQFPVFNQKGDSIYFSMSLAGNTTEGQSILTLNPYHIYEFDLNQKKLIQVTNDEKFFEGFFSLSSDGKWIAFERYVTSESGHFFETELGEDTPQSEIWMYNQSEKRVMQTNLKGLKPYLN